MKLCVSHVNQDFSILANGVYFTIIIKITTLFYDLTKDSIHCKPKPCKAHRELPVSQFSQGKTCFHYREPV